MSQLIALDLGTAMTRVARAQDGLVFEEPTAAAVHVDTGALVAFGAHARGLAHDRARVRVLSPVRAGQLVDLALGEELLNCALRQCGLTRVSRARVVVCAHSNSTDVQRRALQRALRRSGARSVTFVESPLAAAIGLGLSISEPVGQMVIDVGAGVTDCAVLALGAAVSTVAIPTGGNDFDLALKDQLVRHHDVLVDAPARAALLHAVGSIADYRDGPVLEVMGRDLRSGAARRVVLERAELVRVLRRVASPIVGAALRALTAAPPDLANDLLGTGACLTGGASLLPGLDRLLADALGVPVHLSEQVGRLAVLGASKLAQVSSVRAAR